jgi:hypothetical protein
MKERKEVLRHLSIVIDPRGEGLTAYRVSYQRPESPYVPSVLDDGIIYSHPARTEKSIIWARDKENIADVLSYHYPKDWNALQIEENQP